MNRVQYELTPKGLSEFANAHCKGCGKLILWAETPDGKKIPLDTNPIIYEVSKIDGKIIATRWKANLGINHFQTCSKANDFSGNKKK